MKTDPPTLNKTDYETVPPRWELIRDRPVNRSTDDNTFFFFLPDLFFIEKKASAAFITNYVTGLNKTYKICR